MATLAVWKNKLFLTEFFLSLLFYQESSHDLMEEDLRSVCQIIASKKTTQR